MDNRQKEINNLKDYKYGFSTDIENIQSPKGLNEDVIKFISNILLSICDIDYYSQKKTTFITCERQYVSFFIINYT